MDASIIEVDGTRRPPAPHGHELATGAGAKGVSRAAFVIGAKSCMRPIAASLAATVQPRGGILPLAEGFGGGR